MEKLASSYTADGTVKWSSCFKKNSLPGHRKVNHSYHVTQQFTPRYTPEKTKNTLCTQNLECSQQPYSQKVHQRQRETNTI